MILLIGGSSCTGKTVLAQRLLEKYKYPYLSIDHLKMGLIRSGYTSQTPESDERELTAYLWPVVREIIKTAIENNQNLIVEGSYIPFDYRKDFAIEYLRQVRYVCLIFSEEYIANNYADILGYANVVEKRLIDGYCEKELLAEENMNNLRLCKEHGCDYILIDGKYDVDMVL